MAELTVRRVRELLEYDPRSGRMTNRINRGRVKAGAVAGSIANGYRQIGIDGETHYAHRLAWLISTGEWPAGEIDHRDGNRSNNALSNLREASKSSNMQNLRGPRVDSGSGLLGVSLCKQTGRWRATIRVNGRQKSLGRFSSKDEAGAAYLEAKRSFHEGCSI